MNEIPFNLNNDKKINYDFYEYAINYTSRIDSKFFNIIKFEFQKNNIKLESGIPALILFKISLFPEKISIVMFKTYYKITNNLSYQIKKLIKHGYLCAHSSNKDLRYKYLSLTEEGERVANIIKHILSNHLNYFDKDLLDSYKKNSIEILKNLEQIEKSIYETS
jgi:hypothetical protein